MRQTIEIVSWNALIFVEHAQIGLNAAGPEMIRGKAQQRHQIGTDAGCFSQNRVQCPARNTQALLDNRLQYLFEVASVRCSGQLQRAQPLVTLAQQCSQQIFEFLAAVVTPAQQGIELGGQLDFVQRFDHASRRAPIQCLGIVDRLWHRSQPTGHRHGSNQPVAEAVDGADHQPLRVGPQLPLRDPVGQRTGAFGRDLLVGLRLESRVKKPENALVHLGGGLAGKGHGQNFFRCLDRGQQRQEAFHQQRGLARAGRRLNDHRACRINSGAALQVVAHAQFSSMPMPVRRSSMRHKACNWQ